MSQTPFNTGLGRGRARGRRDIADDEQLAERRPGRFRVEDWEGELAGTQSEMESKWKSMEDSAPSPLLGYIHYNHYCTTMHIFTARYYASSRAGLCYSNSSVRRSVCPSQLPYSVQLFNIPFR